jgi:hypothetical protein
VVDEDQFLFTDPRDYIEVASGTLDINRIANNMGLGINGVTCPVALVRQGIFNR